MHCLISDICILGSLRPKSFRIDQYHVAQHWYWLIIELCSALLWTCVGLGEHSMPLCPLSSRCSVNAHTMCHQLSALWILQFKYSISLCQVWTQAKAFQPCLAKLVVHFVEQLNLVPNRNWGRAHPKYKHLILAPKPTQHVHTAEAVNHIKGAFTFKNRWKLTCTKTVHLWQTRYPL